MVSSTVDMHEQYGHELAVIGLNVQEDASVVRDFAAEYRMSYLNLIADEATLRDYWVQGHPLTVLITPEGRVFSTLVGYVDAQALEEEVRALLAIE